MGIVGFDSKNLCAIFAILFCQLFVGQNRIFYEYTFKNDSLNPENIQKELMILDISESKSRFCSYQKLVYDSLLSQNNAKFKALNITNKDFSKITDRSNVKFLVDKFYPEYKTVLYTNIGINNYAVEENSNNINWRISSETDHINGFKVQKAYTSLGGRNWVAWFSDEIPFHEGPYKFHGLPGLILKIEDVSNSHSFKFVGNKKLDENSSILSYNGENTIVKITPENFKMLWKDYVKNPTKGITQLLSSSNTRMTISWEGKSYNTSQIIRDKEKAVKEEVKRNNNKLELSLYKD